MSMSTYIIGVSALQGVPVAPYARKLAIPTFYASATAKQLVIVPGAAHGTALLASSALAQDVTTFIQRHDR
jgi:hypothetical protein